MRNLLLGIVIFFLVSCDDSIYIESFTDDIYELSINPRLPIDINGFYYLTLNNSSIQTTHRLTGRLTRNGTEPYPPEKVFWESSHIWILSDSIGYIIRRVVDVRGRWTNVDTLVIRGFMNQNVPTINCCSYSGTNGEINTVIAPILKMRGDTMLVKAQFKNQTKITKIILK